MNGKTRRLIPLASLALSLVMLPGCQSLTSFHEIEAARPAAFVTAGEQRVHVERWGKAGPKVILLHGFAASTFSFRELGPRLGTRFEVLALDLNGFGFTERPKEPAANGLEAQVELVRTVSGASASQPVHLVGHSYGGMVAAAFAGRYPEAARRLVMISPPVANSELPWAMRNGLTRAASYPFVRAFLSSPRQFRKTFAGAFHREGVFTEEVSEAYRERLLVEGLWDAYHGFPQAAEGGETSPLEEPSRLTKPLLLLAGRHDKIVLLEDLQRFAGLLPDGRLEILEESGHSAPEEEPERVATLISEFLRSQGAGTPSHEQ